MYTQNRQNCNRYYDGLGDKGARALRSPVFPSHIALIALAAPHPLGTRREGSTNSSAVRVQKSIPLSPEDEQLFNEAVTNTTPFLVRFIRHFCPKVRIALLALEVVRVSLRRQTI